MIALSTTGKLTIQIVEIDQKRILVHAGQRQQEIRSIGSSGA